MVENQEPDSTSEAEHVNKRRRTAEKNSNATFIPRGYQEQIFEIARKRNTIACLGTGTGKTFIAILLIRDCADDVRIPFAEGGKRIFFLVPTVPLVNQQATMIRHNTDLLVKGYIGEMNVDKWDFDEWQKQFVENEVLVMTAEIFKRLLEHTFISPERIKLLIIDECHRATKDDPCRQALKYLSDMDRKKLPRIFGLSASLINGKCKPNQLEKRLKDLESTTMCAITTASDLEDLRKYGTDPDEYVVYYSNCNEVAAADLIREIDSLSQKLRSDKPKDDLGVDYSFAEIEVVFFDKPLKCLNALSETLSMLGPWCAYEAAKIYLRELDTLLLRPCVEKYSQTLSKIREFIKHFMEVCLSLNGGSKDIHMEFIPHKLKRLLEIFTAARRSKKFSIDNCPDIEESLESVSFHVDPENYYKLSKQIKSNKNDVQLCSIIFVKQRITAYVLCEWLLKMKEQFADLDFLKPDFIVGHGSIGLSATSMSEKTQRKKVLAFRKHECNVLVATCVLEEGMDIRQCNLVVRFDSVIDFRSYVQSKGRARAKNSIYVLMVQNEAKEITRFLQDMCSFKTIEKLLLSRCYDRALPTDEEISDNRADDALPPYMPMGIEGPRITMSSSISFINMYCSNLPSDMATKLAPRWHIQELDPNNIDTEYICELKMPINSSLRQTVVSEPMRKKKLAKMSAALKACQLLHELGELNVRLVPVSNLVDEAIAEEMNDIEKEDCSGAGTHRRRQIYKKHVPVFLQNALPREGRPCYLHIIQMNLINPLPSILNPRKRPIVDPAETSRGLALLSSTKLPPVNAFPLFMKMGKILVEVELLDAPLFLNKKEIEMVEGFHRFLFADVLYLEKGKMFSPSNSLNPYYILPVNKDSNDRLKVDWEFIKMVEENVYHEQKKGLKGIDANIDYENLMRDAVLLRSYKRKSWETERPTFHHVIRVMNNMTPNSRLNSKSTESFKAFFKRKYHVDINIDDQPMVETVQYPGLHLWKPIYLTPKEVFDDDTISNTKLRRMNYREYLVPELCFLHPFPSSFFLKSVCLPTILFRLNSLLLAEELRQAVAKVTPLLSVRENSWRPFHLETNDKLLRHYLFDQGLLPQVNPAPPLIPRDIMKKGEFISSFEIKQDVTNRPLGPSPSLLLQALTTKGAGDEFDLERLEMIGDSFLKYVMSIKTYFKYSNYDEGKLSSIRSRLIQNLYLYQRAKKKSLGEFMVNSPFNCQRTWLPPCYYIEEVIGEEQESSESEKKLYFTKQEISDKSVADCVEALIGAYLLSSGQKGALGFMTWLGLKPLNHDTDDFNSWPPPPPNPFIPEAYNPRERLSLFIGGFDRFERGIGYTFRNKAYLLQAFTHPSFHYNNLTDCYQRLEFLGDAILDFLITRQLYEDPNDHKPGRLTDLRSALVNNIFFASLAVTYKYHDFLKNCSVELFRLVNRYIELLRESEEFKFFEENRYYLKEIECFEVDEVEVPKALGDIFESVAGAIYLDSGMSLDAVWRVYLPMIKPSLVHLSQHIPLSPVRELYENVRGSENVKNLFGKPFEKNGKTYIEVVLPNGKKYEGVGPNKKVAKRSAAKRALADLKNAEGIMEV